MWGCCMYAVHRKVHCVACVWFSRQFMSLMDGLCSHSSRAQRDCVPDGSQAADADEELVNQYARPVDLLDYASSLRQSQHPLHALADPAASLLALPAVSGTWTTGCWWWARRTGPGPWTPVRETLHLETSLHLHPSAAGPSVWCFFTCDWVVCPPCPLCVCSHPPPPPEANSGEGCANLRMHAGRASRYSLRDVCEPVCIAVNPCALL